MYANDFSTSTFVASKEWKTTTLMPRFTILINKNHAISISTHGEAFRQGYFEITAVRSRACQQERSDAAAEAKGAPLTGEATRAAIPLIENEQASP